MKYSLEGKVWEEVPRTDLPEGVHLLIVCDTADESSPGKVAITNDDKSVVVAISSFASDQLRHVRSSTTWKEISPSAYEELGVAVGAVEAQEPEEPTPPPTQRLLVEKYGEDARVEIECSGWANYLNDDNNGDPWSQDFVLRAGSWDNQCYELSELAEYEIEGVWGVFDMAEAAWIDKLVVKVGEDAFVKEFEGDSKPMACDLEEVVDEFLASELDGK